MSLNDDGKGIKAMLILDIIGRPAQYLVENLEKIIEEMEKEKGVAVKSKSIKDPTTMKENAEFFTTFAEIEVEVEDMLYLAVLMFKYMPAHVEVISPEKISLSNNGWSEILSELVRKLHSYDEVARIVQIEREELLKKIKELTSGKKVDEKSEKKIKKVSEKTGETSDKQPKKKDSKNKK
ncbi:MAG: hypothetical protein AABX79_03325 [Nanoarchaeota archaeon]